MSGDDKSYGLESIILHHSFDQVKGRTIKIPCRERTHLGGVNGAGKTSVLSLVPAFFGEEPERIVTKASGKLSFLDYYLPSFQSLIIFEYRRHTGMCCSVMFRHSAGKICYRFVNGAAEDTFFAPDIKELLQSGASADDIFMALRQKGVGVSRNIDTITNYRAIIQRNQKLLKRLPAESRSLRGLAADYGLGSPDTQMSHIDRLTHVVLNKNRLLSSFKSMICETQFENIHQYARPKAIDRKDLIADIRSLRAFSSEEEKIRSCLRKDAERRAILEQTRQTVANLRVTLEEGREKESELTQQVARLENERQKLKDSFLQRDEQYAIQLNDANVNFKSLDDRLNKLHEQNERYEADGVLAKAQDYGNLADFRQRLATAQADHEQLTGKASEIEGEYEREKERLTYEFDKQQRQRLDKKAQAEAELKNASHAYEQSLKAVEIEQAREVSKYKEERSAERVQISSDEARYKALRDNPGQTDEERQQIAEADAAVAVANDEVAAVSENRLEAAKKRDQARRDRDVAQQQLENLDRELDRLEQEFTALQNRIHPEDGTWLSELRRIDPEWGNDLAKVIDPALLQRKDLAPEFAPANGPRTMMGWRLALDGLPVPEFALSEEELLQQSRQLDEHIAQVRKQRTEAEQEMRRRQETYKSRADAVDHLETEYSIIQRTLANARSRRDSVKARINQAIQERAREYGRLYESSRDKLKAFDEATGAGVRDIENRYQQKMLDLRGHWSETEADFRASIDKLQELIDSAGKEHDERLRKKRQVYDQRLAEEGIDPKVVQESRKALDALKTRVEAILASEDLVRDYLAWRKREWSQVEQLTSQAAEAEAARDRCEQRRKTHQAEYREKDGNLKRSITEHRDAISKLREKLEAAESVLRHFPDIASAEGFPGDLGDLTRELQDAYQKLEQLRREVISTFDRAVAILNQYHDTQIHRAWQKLSSYRRDQTGADEFEQDEAFKLARVPDLRNLLETDIPQLQDALIDQFRSESGSLVKYYEGLDVMAREIKAVSSLLRRKINTDQQIESLQDIRVVLHPRIYEDETWQPLKSFVETWQDWSQLHRRELPDETILRQFQFVSDTLSDAKVRDSIESMIDMHLEMNENGRRVIIRNDADFLSASSTGLTYLAIMAVFMGLTRYLCPDKSTRITWPIDELGTLSDNNIARLAEMLEHNNLTMISACPKLDRALRRFFENKISLKNGRIHTYESPDSGASYAGLLAGLNHDKTEPAAEGGQA